MMTAQPSLVELLYQDEVWVGRDGVRQQLVDMDRHHRANLIPFLRRHAESLQASAVFEALVMYAAAEVAYDAEEAGVAMPEPTSVAPDEWLSRTPLMLKLVELEEGRSFVERKLTHVRNLAYEALTGYRPVAPR